MAPKSRDWKCSQGGEGRTPLLLLLLLLDTKEKEKGIDVGLYGGWMTDGTKGRKGRGCG